MSKAVLGFPVFCLAATLSGLLSPAQGFSGPPAETVKLAEQARGFFKKYCAACHSGPNPASEVEDYDVLDYASLTKKREEDGKPWRYVEPGAQGDKALTMSALWKRAGVKGVAGAGATMPPKKTKIQPTDKERAAPGPTRKRPSGSSSRPLPKPTAAFCASSPSPTCTTTALSARKK